MGCDIHIYLERQLTVNGEKKWVNIDYWKIDPYYPSDSSDKEYQHMSFYSGRNYSLFGVLADVRNDSHNKVISYPKGLPKDVTIQTQKESEGWGEDVHSHSWLTLRELLKAEAQLVDTKEQGMLEPEMYKDFIKNGTLPTEWCKLTNQEDYIYAEWVRPASPLSGLMKQLRERLSTELWIWDFLKEEEKVERLVSNQNDIRIVFWFDN